MPLVLMLNIDSFTGLYLIPEDLSHHQGGPTSGADGA
jgi:hypothetical protein